MPQEFVERKGVRMVEGWPDRIEQAQLQSQYDLVDGSRVDRVRFGSESTDWNARSKPCGDCGVVEGELHVPGCDVEECALCGGQVINCDCPYDDGDLDSPGVA